MARAGCSRRTSPMPCARTSSSVRAPIGQPAPGGELAPLDGLTANGVQLPGFSGASFLGQVTVVNVFASWCGPCRDEHPFVEELALDELAQEGVVAVEWAERFESVPPGAWIVRIAIGDEDERTITVTAA